MVAALLLALGLALPPQRRPPVILAATPACAQLREIAAHEAPEYVFASDGAHWREETGTAVPESAKAVAAAWERGRRIRFVTVTRSGGAANTIEYDDYCFDPAGRLRYMREEFRSVAQDLIAVRERGWTAAGQPNGQERHYFWLASGKPRPAPADAGRQPAAPVYAHTSELPFARFLPKT